MLVGQAEHGVDDPVVRDPQADRQASLADRLDRQDLLGQGDRVPGLDGYHCSADFDPVRHRPTTVAAVGASNSSGICGIQTVASPASSAQRASAWSRSTFVR